MDSYKIPTGQGLEEQVCKALGLDPWLVPRIILDISADTYIKVYVEMIGTDTLLQVDWAAGLQGAEVVKVE